MDEALSLLSGGDWQILAGGTDYYPSLQDRVETGAVMDITRLSDLRSIEKDENGWTIGALATWSDVIAADLPPAFDGLKLAGHEVGSVQIQNRASVVGNLCNASPAADGVPPLLCLDASVRLVSSRGPREMALADFLTGYRASALESDEMVSAILIPGSAGQGRSHFTKLGARKYLVISISMIAARIVVEQGKVAGARIAVGACSVVAKRLLSLETALTGLPLNDDLASAVTEDHFKTLTPIDDVRASADYRRKAAQELVWRTLQQVAA